MLFSEIILIIKITLPLRQIGSLVGDLETMVAMVGRTSGLTRSVLSFSISMCFSGCLPMVGSQQRTRTGLTLARMDTAGLTRPLLDSKSK